MMRSIGRGMLVALAVVSVAGGAGLDVFGDLPGAPPPDAEPSTGAEPTRKATINGAWHRRRADGAVEYLEIYARRRFIYRDSRTATVAGEATVERGELRLQASGSRRVFSYELGADELSLTPSWRDAPENGDLAAMSPRGGATAIYRRSGWERDEWSFAPASTADLLGDYRFEAIPGQVDQLGFLPGNRFVYRGPAAAVLTGAYELVDGLLELRTDQVTRRLRVALTLADDGWSMVLSRDETDRSRPLDDLADVSPALRSEARYTRPLEELTADGLAGRSFEWPGDQTSVGYWLAFGPDGELRCAVGAGDVVLGTYRLVGPRLELRLPDDEGRPVRRRFLAQPLPGGLLLVRDPAASLPDRGLLQHLPPAEQPYARYLAR